MIGHEMTHGLDDSGRRFDAEGNLRNWWTKEDSEEFEKRVKVMVAQGEKFQLYGQHMNGKHTLGENIADLGGVKVAQRALENFLKKQGKDIDNDRINGFTLRQRFFLSWARVWAENSTKESQL